MRNADAERRQRTELTLGRRLAVEKLENPERRLAELHRDDEALVPLLHRPRPPLSEQLAGELAPRLELARVAVDGHELEPLVARAPNRRTDGADRVGREPGGVLRGLGQRRAGGERLTCALERGGSIRPPRP